MNWQEFKQWITPSKADWDWLETSAVRFILAVALIVVFLDTCVWRP